MEHVWLAVFVAAEAMAGALVVTDSPQPATTVRVEAPAQPSESPPARLTNPPVSSAPVSIDEMMRQVIANLAAHPLCTAPPVEPTDEQKAAIEKARPTVPIPPGFPAGTPGAPAAAVDVHRPLVPC